MSEHQSTEITDVVLAEAERESLAEPVYDTYRLGRYPEYLPMWHELETKPVGTPEVQRLCAAVESIVAARLAAQAGRVAEVVEKVHQECIPSRWRSFTNDNTILRCHGQDFGNATRKANRSDNERAWQEWATHVAERVAAELRGGQ